MQAHLRVTCFQVGTRFCLWSASLEGCGLLGWPPGLHLAAVATAGEGAALWILEWGSSGFRCRRGRAARRWLGRGPRDSSVTGFTSWRGHQSSPDAGLAL